MRADITTLSDQAIDHGNSPRLDAVLVQLPKYARVRVANALYNAGVRTLTALCATKRTQLPRWKNMGKKSISDLEGALTSFGLSLAGASMKHEKPQTPAQRVTNPVWLREQISALIESCDDNIAEDQVLADKERDDAKRGLYLERVDSQKHWKRQLERLLCGKTFMEQIIEDAKNAGGCS